MKVATWTGCIIGALALACSGQQAESRQGRMAAAQPRDEPRGSGANSTASNAEAPSQRPSEGAGGLSPHPTAENRNDPQYKSTADANSGRVEKPGLEGRPGLPPADTRNTTAQNGAGSMTGGTNANTSAAARGTTVKELPDVQGRLTRVSSNEIEVTPDSGSAVRLKVNHQTTVAGVEGQVKSLREGEQVRASYDEHSGDKIAVDIRPADRNTSMSGTPSTTPSSTSPATGDTTAPGAPMKSEPAQRNDTGTENGTGSTSGNTTDR